MAEAKDEDILYRHLAVSNFNAMFCSQNCSMGDNIASLVWGKIYFKKCIVTVFQTDYILNEFPRL